MPLMNYTTQIDPNKSVAEIQRILGSKGARQIAVDYTAEGHPSGVIFMLLIEERPLSFRLPCNVEGVHKALCHAKGVPWKLQTEQQARRVAWRIIKDWIEAQLAIVEARQAEMAEVFMPYALDATGQSVYQMFKAAHTKQLTAGEGDEAQQLSAGV